MNTPNPLVPQGSLNEMKNKSHLRIAVCTILGIHVVVIVGLLIAGCKKDNAGTADNQTATNKAPIFEANVPTDTNTIASSTPIQGASNQVVSAPSAPIAPTQTEPTAAPTTEYTIAKGDTFATIGKKFGVGWKAIAI